MEQLPTAWEASRRHGVRAVTHGSSSEERSRATNSLIAIAYADEGAARQARDALGRLQRELQIDLDDAVIAVNDGDRVRLDQSISEAGMGALRGAFWGGLMGLLFVMPVVGMTVGAASGALAGKLGDYGIDDNFAKDLSRQMAPGHAALFLLVRASTPEKVLAELRQFGGTVLHTDLPRDAELRLAAALSGESLKPWGS